MIYELYEEADDFLAKVAGRMWNSVFVWIDLRITIVQQLQMN